MLPRLRALGPVLLTLAIAPVTAEYLIGYDDTLTDPTALVFGVVFFAPLYGAPAVLIREVSRRRGLGWPTMLLLAAAFGLVEAGLVDQSLFDPSYRDIPYWSLMRDPTYLPGLGTSAYMTLTFVAGHVFGSIAAPIALAESWWPARDREPWLGRAGLVVMAILWLLGSAFILLDQLHTTTFRVSGGQLVGTSLLVLALVVLALHLPRPGAARPGAVPAPWVVTAATAALLTVRSLVPTGWVSTLAAAGTIAVWLALVGRWSRRRGWTGRHLVAAVVGDLLSIGGPAFSLTPLGHPDLAAKLVANSVLLALVLAVAAVGWLRQTAGRERRCAA